MSKESEVDQQREDILPSTLNSLLVHLKNDKKFNRAVPILISLIESQLKLETSHLFFDLICEFMSECERDVCDRKYTNFYVDLWMAIGNLIHCFSSSQRYRLETFSIYALTRNQLLTDDSYTFNKACAVVKGVITDPKSFNSKDDATALSDEEVESNNALNELILERQKVIVSAVEQCSKQYRLSWAQPSVDELIQLASERRLLLREEERDALDAVTQKITLIKRKNTSYTGPQKIVSQNAHAHPLFVKRHDRVI